MRIDVAFQVANRLQIFRRLHHECDGITNHAGHRQLAFLVSRFLSNSRRRLSELCFIAKSVFRHQGFDVCLTGLVEGCRHSQPDDHLDC